MHGLYFLGFISKSVKTRSTFLALFLDGKKVLSDATLGYFCAKFRCVYVGFHPPTVQTCWLD